MPFSFRNIFITLLLSFCSVVTFAQSETDAAVAASAEWDIQQLGGSLSAQRVKVKYKFASLHFKERFGKPFATNTTYKPNTVEALNEHSLRVHCFMPLMKGKEVLGEDTLTYVFTMTEDSVIDFKITSTCRDVQHLNFRLPHWKNTKEENHFWGLGEQFSMLDFKNTRPTVYTEEQGLGRGDKPISGFTKLFGVSGDRFTSYSPLPLFLTEQNRAVVVETPSRVKFDFTDEADTDISIDANHAEGKIIYADSRKALLEKLTAHTGRMPALPDWAYGTILGLQGGADKVKRIVEEQKAAGNPVTAVWLQDWVGRRKTRFGSQLWWTWKPDETAYPKFKEFCAEMKAQNVKVLGYVNSFLANEGEYYEEAKAKNYLVKNAKGEDYEIETAGFPAYLVDLTNPSAFEWLKSIIKKELIDAGMSGWMADYGEWLPLDAKLFSGEEAAAYHGQYAVDWARLNREAIQEAGKVGEIVFFNRSGALGIAKYSTLMWAGDQMVDFGEHDGLPSAVCAMISSGLSGITLNHTDIGGYTTIDNVLLRVKRSDEVMKRWIEFACFTPVFRTHEGLKPDANVQVYSNDSIARFFSRFGRLHFALKDYFNALNKEATETGMPVVRALLVEFPQDTNTYSNKDEFMLGEDLLVAPVVKKKADSRTVYLPKGKWKNAWTDKVYEGANSYTIDAPFGSPPVFIRMGGAWEKALREVFGKF